MGRMKIWGCMQTFFIWALLIIFFFIECFWVAVTSKVCCVTKPDESLFRTNLDQVTVLSILCLKKGKIRISFFSLTREKLTPALEKCSIPSNGIPMVKKTGNNLMLKIEECF